MNPFIQLYRIITMDTLITDMLRQRKLLLWRKIMETFPIKKSHREHITKKILPQSSMDLQERFERQKSEIPHDDTPTAPHCSETDR